MHSRHRHFAAQALKPTTDLIHIFLTALNHKIAVLATLASAHYLGTDSILVDRHLPLVGAYFRNRKTPL